MALMVTTAEDLPAASRSAGSPAAESERPDLRTLRQMVLTIASGTAAVAAITFVGYRFHLNLTTAAFLHLTVVVLIARRSGFWPASAISILAVVCQLYFLVPPVLTWVVADPQNWIALATFEYCALVVSRLSGRAAEQTQVAIRRREETEGLYEISRLILLMDRAQAPGPQLAGLIVRVFQCESAGVYDAEAARFAAAGSTGADLERKAKHTYIGAKEWFDKADHTWYCVLRMGVRPVGALALCGGRIGEPVAGALASLVAVALERFRSLEKENRAEAARQNEQLRTAVLDALAHDVKTPLTAIRTASSGLLEMGGLGPAQGELVSLIDSEAGRLDDITNRLLVMARLDEREVRLRPRSLRIDALLRRVVNGFEGRTQGHAIRITGLETGMAVSGDEQLLGMALAQLVDNAIKYSASASEIAIRAEHGRGGIVLSVNNQGPAIQAPELERIFERFYRATGTAQQIAGTGLGLSVARKIAAAHSGRVWATSDPDAGTTFFFALPALSGGMQDGALSPPGIPGALETAGSSPISEGD